MILAILNVVKRKQVTVTSSEYKQDTITTLLTVTRGQGSAVVIAIIVKKVEAKVYN